MVEGGSTGRTHWQTEQREPQSVVEVTQGGFEHEDEMFCGVSTRGMKIWKGSNERLGSIQGPLPYLAGKPVFITRSFWIRALIEDQALYR